MTHKIRGIAKEICTAEQKIAYNMALRANGRWGDRFRSLSTEAAKSDAVFKIRDEMIHEWKLGYTYREGKYDEDAVFTALNRGLERYLEKPFVAMEYAPIGECFS